MLDRPLTIPKVSSERRSENFKTQHAQRNCTTEGTEITEKTRARFFSVISVPSVVQFLWACCVLKFSLRRSEDTFGMVKGRSSMPFYQISEIEPFELLPGLRI